MKIASWNLAGLRARLAILPEWLQKNNFDIICLQETKIQDKDFPLDFFASYGYHSSILGQKSFNGVAILSKISPEETEPLFFCDEQARALRCSFSYKNRFFHICSLYFPNGNPIDSPKYDYKLSWMETFYDFAQQTLTKEEAIIFAGDFNVIPQKFDAKFPEKWRNDALFSPKIRKLFFRLCHLGYQDAIRLMNDEACYSFWDFQKQAFARDDGIRIDHFLLCPQASDLLNNAYVQHSVRSWDKPSDHAPIVLELSL